MTSQLVGSISQGRGCPLCIDMVNGARVSKQQRSVAGLLDAELNILCGRLRVDVALVIKGIRIAIEYDSWYWHGSRVDKDIARDKCLLSAGWRILRIKSNILLPTYSELHLAIQRLLDGSSQEEIRLKDWGVGNLFRQERSVLRA